MKRVLVAGVLIGIIGVVSVNVAHLVEHYAFGAIGRFMEATAGALPHNFDAGLAFVGLVVLTLAMGLGLSLVYRLAAPSVRPMGYRGGALVGLVCWMGFCIPLQAIMVLFSRIPVPVVATNLVGWLVMFVVGGLVAHRLMGKEEVS